MSQTPTNPKLWAMLIAQAKTKFHPFPSIAASAWVHKQYTQEGGQFVQADKRKATGRRR